MKGHITEKGKEKYQLVVTIGSDYRGKLRRFYKTVKAKDYEEAKMMLAVFYKDCEQNRVVTANKITFEEFVKIWDEQYARPQLKKSTYVTDKRNLAKNFEMFNKRKLNAIKPFHIRQWITTLTIERGLSPKSVKNNYSLLRSILQKAVQWEYISQNPAANMELPKPKPHEAGFYNNEQVDRLLDVLSMVDEKHLNYVVAVLLGLFGGLRRGEMCGIDEKDVDFENGVIKIRQTRMVYGSGGLYVDTPKSLRSARVITLPKTVMDTIERLLRFQRGQRIGIEEIWVGSPALLKNEIGAPIYPQSIYRWFIKLQNENNLPHLSIHGLRHTHTAMLVDCSTNLENISKRLGHSQKSTTLEIYSHLFSNRDTELANQLDAMYLR